MPKSPEQQIFKQGSTTHYFSARFFPKKIRRDVARLYSFMRVADDFVDQTPAEPDKLIEVEKQYRAALKEQHFDVTTHQWDEAPTRITKNIVRLTQKYKFDPAWVEAFFAAMKTDLKTVRYQKLEDTLGYVYGSAEVVGLMMAKIMQLPEEAFEAAKLQGRAFQWINFIRDIKEDNTLKRQYFPQEDFDKAGLKDLTEESARENPEAFRKFIDIQLNRYRKWQAEASEGFQHIPKRLRIPLQTATDMYDWTANRIEKDPFIVFDHKLKPKKAKVILKALGKSTIAAGQGTAALAKEAVRKIRSRK